MKDRISTYPGRVKLTPVTGEANTFNLERADVPVEEGTPLHKATLLQDATAALAGLGQDATPDEVFTRILTRLLKVQTVTLQGDGWTGDDAPYRQTVAVLYVSADEAGQGIFPAPATASRAEWNRIQAMAVEQGVNKLVFEAQERTIENLTVHVLIQEVL